MGRIVIGRSWMVLSVLALLVVTACSGLVEEVDDARGHGPGSPGTGGGVPIDMTGSESIPDAMTGCEVIQDAMTGSERVPDAMTGSERVPDAMTAF
jgi:hypothetical protein